MNQKTIAFVPQPCLWSVQPDRCGPHPMEGGELAPCRPEGCPDYEPRFVKNEPSNKEK